MGQELGRISGVMLKDNLERLGIDLTIDTDLLKLDVNNTSISINSLATDADTALFVNSAIKTTGLQVDTRLKLDSIDITTSNNTILSKGGDLYLSSTNSIITDNIRTDDLNFDDNTISSTSSNQPIEIRPDGNGEVNLSSTLNVTGNLHASGDILIEGTVVFGDTTDANIEKVEINAAINSDLIPSENELFSLGSEELRWLDVYPNLLNGQTITAGSAEANGIDLTLRQGNTWYVSQNGSDLNYGNHEASTFRTIKHALENSGVDGIKPGDTVMIYPGTYEEITPLVVPQGVSIRGTSLRSVTVTADPTTISNNVFELNGETTVSDLTVTNFRYNAVNDTGYAFSFADNFAVTSRSPYIQNVSVITSGSITSVADPRGFASGDAGKGALVDGAKALPTSKEATMLFHSVTFITPGVDALTMRNGVRVEWLNSFVYFANIAMYATAGVGRYDAALDITRYGAEVRSIGSACVYGNYGAWAEGQGTLMYLINHNFGYIGAGKDVSNDPSLQITDNEVTMLDTGKIYFQSVDNKGNFTVGDPFTVSFETGTASIGGFGVTATGISSILFGSETSDTVVNSDIVSTGNIKFSGNTLTSITGPVNLLPSVDKVNLAFNVSAKQNILIDNDFSLKGVLTLGNQLIDMAEFNAPTDSDILPSVDRKYSFGGDYILTGFGAPQLIPHKRWNKVINQVSLIDGNIRLSDNVIQSTVSNADLELRTNGTGAITLETNNLIIDNQLTVDGTSTTNNIDITGFLHQTGNTSQTGDRSISNSADITGNISATVQATIETISISQGLITTNASNADLELRAAGIGEVIIPTSDVLIQNNLTVNGLMTASDAIVTNQIASTQFDSPDISFYSNTITTTGLDQNLIIGANGVGTVITETSDVTLGQGLQVDGLSTLGNVVTVGDTVHNGTFNLTGDLTQTGNYILSNNLTVSLTAHFDNINIENNVITTVDSNSDLELRAAGSGIVNINDNFRIENNLHVIGITETNGLTNSGIIESDTFSDTDIEISTNVIKTTVGSNDLRLLAAGTGVVSAPNNAVEVNQNLTVNGVTDVNSVQIGEDTIPVSLIRTLDNPNPVGTSTGDYFGISVAISGSRLIVGAEKEDDVGTDSGKAYVYDLDTNSLLYTLNNPNAIGSSDDDSFGSSVGISDLYAIVGARGESNVSASFSYQGKAYIFNAATGALLHTLNNPNPAPTNLQEDMFGWQVAISGSQAIVSAPVFNGTHSGSAHIFNAATGTLLYTLSNPDPFVSTADRFGFSASISPSYAIVGAPLEDETGNASSGKAYIYNTTTGALLHTLNNPNSVSTSANDLFGTSVAISESYAVVGARNERQAGTLASQSGAVYIFDPVTGVLLRTLTNPNPFGSALLDKFGSSVAISGSRLVVGASLFSTTSIGDNLGGEGDAASSINRSGKAYIFDIPTGALLHTLDNPNAFGTVTSDYFGSAVAISDSYNVASATREDDASGSDSGKVYVFSQLQLPEPAALTVTGTINRTGNVTETGNYTLSNNLTVSETVSLTDIDIDNNVITTSDSNSDLELRASGTGQIIIDDVFRIVPAAQIETLVTTGIANSATVTSDVFTNGTILINDNYFTTVSGNTDLVLQAPATKNIYLPFDPLLIDNDLTVVNTTSIRNGIINGDILHTGNILQTGNVVQTGDKSISTNLTVTSTTALFPDISIIDNVIKTLSTNSDLELRAVGSGVIRAASDNVAITQQLTVNGTTATSAINNSGSIYSDQFTNGDILIKDNFITTTSGTTNLRLLGNSLGGPGLEKIKFNANVISTESLNDNIVLTVSNNSLLITGTNALKIPVGTASARVSNNTGDIRLDTTDSLFSGWNGARVTFGGLYSTNRLTQVSAHPTNNTINFVTNSVTSMTLTETGITPNALLVDNNLFFNNNTISATGLNSNVFLSPNGTGSLTIENIEIQENTITNLKSTAPLVLQNTGFGYVAFGGTGALAIPAGPTITPPPGTELGDFRFNTTLSTAEIFNGIEYVSLSGGSGSGLLTADEIQEITNLWGIILG